MSDAQGTLFGLENLNNSLEKNNKKPLMTKDYISSIWTFEGRGGKQPYRWYGTLPESLVSRIFNLYGEKGGNFFDAFLGLGSSLGIATKNEMHPTGIDINPLACLAAETRYSEVNIKKTINRAKVISQELLKNNLQQTEHSNAFSEELKKDKYDYVKKWFRKDTLITVLGMLEAISMENDIGVQRALFVGASQVIRHVASVDPRCTHHLVTKKKPYINPSTVFSKHVENVTNSVTSIRKKETYRPRIIQSTILDPNVNLGIHDLVLLHPPYLGVINYHLIHRLATDLLDLVQNTFNPKSLSGYFFDNGHIKSSDMSTDSTNKYLGYVNQMTQQVVNHTANDGRCVLIIGDQRYKGHLRHTFTNYINQFEEAGLILEDMFIWVLQNHGGLHVKRKGNFIDHNYILVFHKP